MNKCLLTVLLFTLWSCGAATDNTLTTNTKLQSLSFDSFVEADINVVFNTQFSTEEFGVVTCASAQCHHPETGSGGSFRVWPAISDADDPRMQQNYLSASAFIRLDKPEASPLLLEPLAGSFANVGNHGGGDLFLGTADIRYLIIYDWAATAAASTAVDN